MPDLTATQLQLIIKALTNYCNLNVSISSDRYKEYQEILSFLNHLK